MDQSAPVNKSAWFHHETLESLLKTQDIANGYLGKRVSVSQKFRTSTVVVWDQKFEGIISCIGTNFRIVFNFVVWEQCAPTVHEDMTQNIEVECSEIEEITLLDGQSISIKDVVVDACRLKTIRNIIHEMKASEFSSKLRNRFLCSKSKSEKQQIGKRISSFQIPNDDPSEFKFAETLLNAMRSDPHSLNGHPISEVWSLLREFHKIWVQHIERELKHGDCDDDDDAKTEISSGKSYMDWDQIKKPSDINRGRGRGVCYPRGRGAGFLYNGTPILMSPQLAPIVYPLPMKTGIPQPVHRPLMLTPLNGMTSLHYSKPMSPPEQNYGMRRIPRARDIPPSYPPIAANGMYGVDSMYYSRSRYRGEARAPMTRRGRGRSVGMRRGRDTIRGRGIRRGRGARARPRGYYKKY